MNVKLTQHNKSPDHTGTQVTYLEIKRKTKVQDYIFHFLQRITSRDGKGTVNLIRECLKTASIGTEIESRIKCPTIVHSTMLRFVDSTDVPLSFRKIFTDIFI